MAADANTGTGSVGDGSVAVVVELVRDVGKLGASADRSPPRISVHREILHVD